MNKSNQYFKQYAHTESLSRRECNKVILVQHSKNRKHEILQSSNHFPAISSLYLSTLHHQHEDLGKTMVIFLAHIHKNKCSLW